MPHSHDILTSLFDYYITESNKFETDGNNSAGTRARKALIEITKIAKDRRKEIQATKNGE